MSEHERFLRGFHAAHPGITARAMERGGSYDRLAARATGWELDLGGTFDEVWTFLGASYELTPEAAIAIHDELAAHYAPDARVPCSVVTWCASIRR